MNEYIYVYVRPWNAKFYADLVTTSFPRHRKVFLSEFKGVGDVWLGKALYQSGDKFPFFSEKESFEIYLRCRFLRKLSKNLAYDLIQKTAIFIDRLLDDGRKIDLVLGNLIDNFTLDILERICKRKNICFVSFVSHFFMGYCRLTRRGELIRIREKISEDEVREVTKKVTSINYYPNFELNKKRNKGEILKFYLRELFKEQVYFQFKKMLKGEILNYHYNTYFYNTDRSFSNFFANHESFFTRDPEGNNASVVYFPLHYTPEATVDYWCDDPQCALYEKSVLHVIDQSSKDFTFWVKEHPAMYYKRSHLFYREILKRTNVQLIHPYVNSNEILSRCSIVYVYTGSVGVEALMREKFVFTRTDNYYSHLHPNVKKRNYLLREDQKIDFKIYPVENFVSELLGGLIPATFKNDKSIGDSDLLMIAGYLRKFYDDHINTTFGKSSLD